MVQRILECQFDLGFANDGMDGITFTRYFGMSRRCTGRSKKGCRDRSSSRGSGSDDPSRYWLKTEFSPCKRDRRSSSPRCGGKKGPSTCGAEPKLKSPPPRGQVPKKPKKHTARPPAEGKAADLFMRRQAEERDAFIREEKQRQDLEFKQQLEEQRLAILEKIAIEAEREARQKAEERQRIEAGHRRIKEERKAETARNKARKVALKEQQRALAREQARWIAIATPIVPPAGVDVAVPPAGVDVVVPPAGVDVAVPPAGVDVAVPPAGIGAYPECCVCLDAEAKQMLVPCGHLCVCLTCANTLDGDCPKCRQKITGRVHVYL